MGCWGGGAAQQIENIAQRQLDCCAQNSPVCCVAESQNCPLRLPIILSTDFHSRLDVEDSHSYALPRKGAKHCDQRVGASVCPLAYLKNYMSKLHEIYCSLRVVCGRGSIHFRRQCSMLCTFGFVDDVAFSHNIGHCVVYGLRPRYTSIRVNNAERGGVSALELHIVCVASR